MPPGAAQRAHARTTDPARGADYDDVVLGVLVYEFFPQNVPESERKIRGRLRRKKLGPYDPRRVEILRRLKDELQVEIHKARRSAYFLGYHGKYCEMRDFDVPRLVRDMKQRHPRVRRRRIDWFVPFCVFTYYLR
jgi:hypothetical protein